MSLVLTEQHGHVTIITMNKPEKMNSYNVALHDELIAAIQTANDDPNVRVIIVTGAGRAFCAGADISDGFSGAGFTEAPPQIHDIDRDYGGILTLAMHECDTPIIAAINGVAVGIGATMTLPMDIKIISNKAKMGFPFARRGIVFDAASSWFLPRMIGWTKAQELILTGRIFKAEEADKLGLVNYIVEPEQVLPKALEIAQDIAQNCAPKSVAQNKQLLRASLTNDFDYGKGVMRGPLAAHVMESDMLNKAFLSADCHEGVQSFLEKRPPEFSNYDPKED